jgi:hypothetical protein
MKEKRRGSIQYYRRRIGTAGGSSKHNSGPRVEPDESDNQAFLEAAQQE